jgi:predicted molibdopterin-dependent oxidoreductase YjgC
MSVLDAGAGCEGVVPLGNAKGGEMGKRYERLTTPMIRVDDQLVETTWDVALERAAAGFREASGGSTGVFSCSKATNEMNYVAQKFARTVLHTNNVDSCNRT